MKFTPLFDGRLLRLTPLDIEKDAPVVASWTYDPEVVSHLKQGSVQPMNAFEVRKVMEEWKKAVEESGHTFVFGLRPLGEERILGFLHMAYIQWVHGAGQFRLVIGDAADWDLYANEALRMVLVYAFEELNLFRVKAHISEDNTAGYALYQEAGFYLEVRQRQAIYRDGRYLDQLHFGMLRPEWDMIRSQEVA